MEVLDIILYIDAYLRRGALILVNDVTHRFAEGHSDLWEGYVIMIILGSTGEYSDFVVLHWYAGVYTGVW
jgi:hypothetical protein